MVRVVGLIQARMGSTRLPGKVLIDIEGKPMLQQVVERLSRAKRLDEVAIATSTHSQDAPIVELAEKLGIRAVRGSEDDVLARYVQACETTRADVAVRITSDCPIIDPALVDRTVDLYFREDVDYAANCIQQTFPRGNEVEVFSAERLAEAAGEAVQPLEREHVTPHFYLNPDKYRLIFLAAEGELRRKDLRFCVDTPDDLALIRAVFAKLGPGNDFPLIEVVRLVGREPELLRLNAHISQKKLGE